MMFQSFLIIGMCNEDQYTTITDMTNPTNGLNKVIELSIVTQYWKTILIAAFLSFELCT